MRKIVHTLSLLAAFAALPVYAEDAARGSVGGRVVIEGESPAVGATVILGGTRLGAAADDEGAFLISGVPSGTYEVRARLVGYRQTDSVSVTVRHNQISEVLIRLRQEAIVLNQVVVSGTARQGAEDVRPSVSSLPPHESKALPGAAEDVLRSLQALPGVTSTSDFSSQLVIRGSGPDQNLIMIDGFEVLNPYRLYGFVSMFNPETLSDISLQTGGFSAQYGDRLSAVLDVKNREGRTDAYVRGKINTSLTNLNAIIEGRFPVVDASYLVSVRRTYYDLILGPVLKSAKLVQGDVALPNFRDIQVKLAFPLNSENKILLNGVTSRDGVSVVSGQERERPDSVNVIDESFNTLLGVTWQYNPSPRVIARTQFSWYRNNGSGLFDGTFVDPAQNTGDLSLPDTARLRFVRFGVDYDYVYSKISLGQNLLWNAGWHILEVGYGVDVLRTDFIRFFEIDDAFRTYLQSIGSVVPTDATESVRTARYNVYVQDRLDIGDRFYVQPGLRLDVYPALHNAAAIAPRIGLSYRLDDLSTLRAAYGIYYQSPGMEKLDFRSQIVFNEEYLSSLVAERADHYILGYDRMLTPDWQFKTEAYYKDFRDAIAPEKLQGTAWSTQHTGGSVFSPSQWSTPVRIQADSLTNRPVNDARGHAYGVELMIQKIRSLPSDRISGWVSYAYSFAQRERDGIVSPFQFDQRHAVNVVGSYRFAERWDVGVRYTLRSGRPYREALGVQPRIVEQTVNGATVPVVQVDTDGNALLDVVYERDTFSGRLALYSALDIRVTTYPQWFGLDWSVYLDLQNVSNHQNEQQARYFIDAAGALQRRAVYGIPIFPSLGLSVSF